MVFLAAAIIIINNIINIINNIINKLDWYRGNCFLRVLQNKRETVQLQNNLIQEGLHVPASESLQSKREGQVVQKVIIVGN